MAAATDESGIQFRILNSSKGPAVGATRAHADRIRYKAAIREREAAWKELWNLEVPMFIDTSKGIPPISSLPRKGDSQVERASVGTTLTGAAASQGIVEGKVRVVLGTDSISDFQPGEILVAPQTDPSWTPLFMVASGVIVNTGSMGSHAMIVARVNGATGVVEVLAV